MLLLYCIIQQYLQLSSHSLYISTFKVPFSSIHSFTFTGTLSFDDDMGKRKGTEMKSITATAVNINHC